MLEQGYGHRVHAWGEDPRWEALDRPAPAAGEVLVQVEACGIGLTVLNAMNGDLAAEPGLLPRVPGHELVGRVVGAGDAAGEHLVGRRVVAYFYLFCGVCRACVAGQESRCDSLAGWVGVHRDGGYGPFATLPARNALPVPDELDPVSATVVPDAVATSIHVCATRARLGIDDRVVVIGAGGGVGAHLTQVARLHGAEVVAVDVSPGKLAALDDLGARAIDGRQLPPAAAADLWSGGGPTAVVDLVGSAETLQWSVDALGMGGRLVVLTTFPDRTLTLDPRDMVFRERAVIASRYAARAEVVQAAELVLRGDVEPVIGQTVEASQALDVHDRLRHGELWGRGALWWPAGDEAVSA